MMKNFLSVLAIASAVFMCNTLQAANTPGKLLMKVETLANTNLTLHLANLQQKTTVVSILDLDGTTFLRQTIRDHNGYAIQFNLEELPNGRYMLAVSQKGKQMKQVLYKNESTILVSQVMAAK